MVTAPEHERFHGMADHDLLVEIAVKTDALEKHSKEQNGQIASLVSARWRIEGALIMMAALLPLAIAVAALLR